MKIIHAVHPNDFVQYTTQQIRERFLLENLVVEDSVHCAYTHYDRMIIGAAYPVQTSVSLGNYDQLKAAYFLERREMGIINIAGNGTVYADGEAFELEKLDCLYIGKGKKKRFGSKAEAVLIRPGLFSFRRRHTRSILCRR